MEMSISNLPRHTAKRLTAVLAAIVYILSAASETANAQGRPIKATLTQNLEFGIIGATNVTGTATMRSDGVKLVSAGVFDLGGLSQPAVFLVQGEKFTPFFITLPTSATVTLPGGTNAVLSDFESSPAISGVLDKRGQAVVAVGATMNLTPSLWEGTYSGTFDIIVTYQ